MHVTDEDEDLADIRRDVALSLLPAEAIELLRTQHMPQDYLIDFYGPQIDEAAAHARVDEIIILLRESLSESKEINDLYALMAYYTKHVRTNIASPADERFFEARFKAVFPLDLMFSFFAGQITATVLAWAFDKSAVAGVTQPQIARHVNAWFLMIDRAVPGLW